MSWWCLCCGVLVCRVFFHATCSGTVPKKCGYPNRKNTRPMHPFLEWNHDRKHSILGYPNSGSICHVPEEKHYSGSLTFCFLMSKISYCSFLHDLKISSFNVENRKKNESCLMNDAIFVKKNAWFSSPTITRKNYSFIMKRFHDRLWNGPPKMQKASAKCSSASLGYAASTSGFDRRIHANAFRGKWGVRSLCFTSRGCVQYLYYHILSVCLSVHKRPET